MMMMLSTTARLNATTVLPWVSNFKEAIEPPSQSRSGLTEEKRVAFSAQHAQAHFMPVGIRSGTKAFSIYDLVAVVKSEKNPSKLQSFVPQALQLLFEDQASQRLEPLKPKIASSHFFQGTNFPCLIRGTATPPDINKYIDALPLVVSKLDKSEQKPFIQFLAERLSLTLKNNQAEKGVKPTLITELQLPKLVETYGIKKVLEAFSTEQDAETNKPIYTNLYKTSLVLVRDFLYSQTIGTEQDPIKQLVKSEQLLTLMLGKLPKNSYQEKQRWEVENQTNHLNKYLTAFSTLRTALINPS
jgi:hypothetical protein